MIIVISVQDPYPDPDPQKYADPKSKNQPKTAKNFFTELLKKREIIKISSCLNGSLSLRILKK